MSAGKAPEHAASAAIVSGVAGRYAVALFELARDAGALDAVSSDFARLDALTEQSPEVRTILHSPLLSRSERGRAVAAMIAAIAGQGTGFHKLTANLLGVLARNGRLHAAAAVGADFHALLAVERGEAAAEVTSAQALSPAQADALKAKLRDITGREVQLKTRVDAGILGGLIVKIGSTMIDSSLRTKLNNLQVAMKEVG